MSDNLPLIPQKDSGPLCADVRPLIREVFRELNYLPPLPATLQVENGSKRTDTTPFLGIWSEKCTPEFDNIWRWEETLQREFAKRLCKRPLPNTYKLSQPNSLRKTPQLWKEEYGIIEREDLIPSIEENVAGRVGNLWVNNLLNESSCDVSAVDIKGSPTLSPGRFTFVGEYSSLKTLSLSANSLTSTPVVFASISSIGEIPSLPVLVSTESSQPPPPPEHIVCVPPQLHFVNFTLGHQHTQQVRLVNVSKFEVRLSVRPPSRRELQVELRSPRGLTVTCGSAAEMRVHFTPSDVRTLCDRLVVRVSLGGELVIPIVCYMQPPLLDILVPNVNASLLSCVPVEETCAAVVRADDVLDLGARLVGDLHCVQLVLHCAVAHAAFFIITEDAWLTSSVQLWCAGSVVSVVSGEMGVSPAWWCGGGTVRGTAWCGARDAGLHAAALRVLSSTALVRPLTILADSLHFSPTHLTLQADEKDYDICSEDDPACEYYVNLGTAFPNRALSATVRLINHSPVVYSYYWSVRPWGVCSCEEEASEDRVASGSQSQRSGSESQRSGSESQRSGGESQCSGARTAGYDDKQRNSRELMEQYARDLRVQPASGRIAPRASLTTSVCVPDVGQQLGVHRAVLMLILKEIPKESFPPDYEPMVVNTEVVQDEYVPGLKRGPREVCEVVCAQMEVWCDVVPVRFVIDPVLLHLPHSRRVTHVEIRYRATQLFGSEGIRGWWSVPASATPLPPALLSAAHSWEASLRLPLSPESMDPIDHLITLEGNDEEWRYSSVIRTWSATRHPPLAPAIRFFAVVPPRDEITARFTIDNTTHEHIAWSAVAWNWCGGSPPFAACVEKACDECHQSTCTCASLKPRCGAVPHSLANIVNYEAQTPNRDGCVLTLIQLHREIEGNRSPAVSGSEARASLFGYRVLAPRIVLRVLPCDGHRTQCIGPGEECRLDGGTGLLRPNRSLVLGQRTLYLLRYTNITPTPTTITWEPPLQGESDHLKVTFQQKEVDVGPYEVVTTQLEMEALRVTSLSRRRLSVLRAQVSRAYKPLYLLIDAAVSGLEVICEVPLGGGKQNDGFSLLRMSQKEECPRGGLDEMFAEDDRRRAFQQEAVCRCKYEWKYTPPEKRPQPPPKQPEDPDNPDHYPPVEIVEEIPPLTRVCPCCKRVRPIIPDHEEPCCLQFRQLPLRTVRTRCVKVRNVSNLSAQWSVHVRRWTPHKTRKLDKDGLSKEIPDPGLAIECSPEGGVLGPLAEICITVKVYADCWGLYMDQILIKISNLEPIIVDLWVEAFGLPLQFALNSTEGRDCSPVLWMSSSDRERSLRVKNISRSDLMIEAYVLKEYEYEQDRLPFRLYIRFFETKSRYCPCLHKLDSESVYEEQTKSSTVTEDADVGIQLYLAPDHGIQEDTNFLVSPELTNLPAGESRYWNIQLTPPEHNEVAAPGVLMLRALPTEETKSGPHWFRLEQNPQTVSLRHVPREGFLRLSCCELRVTMCALDLPYAELLRVRKRVHVLNAGNGFLDISARTEPPWSVFLSEEGGGCGCRQFRGARESQLDMRLEPNSSTEVTNLVILCVEVSIHSGNVFPQEVNRPTQTPVYDQRRITCTQLLFCDDDNVLQKLPLILEMEYPIIEVTPTSIDLKYVTNGDTRKTYFTVSHSSKKATIELEVQPMGAKEFSLWPKTVRVSPGSRELVYVQYHARWSEAPAECHVRVQATGGSGSEAGWCYAVVAVRAMPTHDSKWHLPVHDYTDDHHLLPPGLPL